MGKHAIHTAGLLAALVLAAAARAGDPPDDFKTGPIDCDVLKKDPDARYHIALRGARDGRGDDTGSLDALRAKFWETYPRGKGHVEAREALAQALYIKDMYYLQANLGIRIIDADNRELERKGEDAAMNQALKFLGFELDGGIPRVAQPEFFAWVRAARARLGHARRPEDILAKGFQVGLGILSETFRDCFDAGGKEYQAYLMERDWAEFERAHRLPAGYDDDQHYGIYLYFRMAHYGYAQGERTYRGFVTAMGEKNVVAAVHAVRAAEKTPSGDLVTHVPRPVKRGPGGGEVDDYDVPFPPGVIGVYSSQLVAMEMQATEDSDEHYLIKLLSGRFVDDYNFPRALRGTQDKWTWAASMCRALKAAFGPEPVAAAAHAIHTAKRRLISGSIMNQEVLGATRNAPLECFEDIVCRQNPRGYVLCAVAMKENPLDPGAVQLDAAYRAAIAKTDEGQLLAAAKRAAAGKPHLGGMLDLNGLIALISQPETVEAPVAMIDYPPYHDWKRFAPGTQVAYVQRTWLPTGAKLDTLAPRPAPDLRFMYTLTSVTPDQVLAWHTEQAFDWRNGAAHQPRDTEIGYPAKVPAPSPEAAARTAAAERFRLTRHLLGPPVGEPKVESGEETLVIAGRQLHCQWTSETLLAANSAAIVKTWTCDEIPTGLVRKLEDAIYGGDGRHPTP